MMKFSLMIKEVLIAVMAVTILGMPIIGFGEDRTGNSTWENEEALRKDIFSGLQEEQLKTIFNEKKSEYFYISKKELTRTGGFKGFDPNEDIDGIYIVWGKREFISGGLFRSIIRYTIYVKGGVVTRINAEDIITGP